jgi:hypothetical protein
MSIHRMKTVDSLKNNNRCKRLTAAGERCKNRARFGDYCYIHRDVGFGKFTGKAEAVGKVLGAATALITIVEKVHAYAPQVLHWAWLIANRMCCPNPAPLTTRWLRKDIKQGTLGNLEAVANLLNRPMKSLDSDLPNEFKHIPQSLQKGLIEASKNVLKSIEELKKRRDEETEEVKKAGLKLVDLVEQAANSSPRLTQWIADTLTTRDNELKPEWWRMEALKHDQIYWRYTMLAEFMETQLTSGDATRGQLSPVEYIPRELQDSILLQCDLVMQSAASLEKLESFY